jgi:hypothetical protein
LRQLDRGWKMILLTIRSKFEPMSIAGCLLLALFGHAAISELSLLSGVKRKLDLEPAKGSFWRKAEVDRKLAVA